MTLSSNAFGDMPVSHTVACGSTCCSNQCNGMFLKERRPEVRFTCLPVSTCQSICGSNSVCTGTFQISPSYTCSCQIGYVNISGVCLLSTASTTTTVTTTTLSPPTCSGKLCKLCPVYPYRCYDCSGLSLNSAGCNNIPTNSIQLFVSEA